MAIFVIAKPPTFHTDFNKRDAEGRPVAVPGGGTMYWLGPYPEGTRVRLVDAEGNSCEAVLDEVDGQILKFRPDWETWSEGEVWFSPNGYGSGSNLSALPNPQFSC